MKMLQSITDCENLEVASRLYTEYNCTLNILHQRFFFEYVTKTSCFKNILRKKSMM